MREQFKGFNQLVGLLCTGALMDGNLLGKGNLIFCCTGQTDPNFWQIKKIILILHTQFSIFYNLYFL